MDTVLKPFGAMNGIRTAAVASSSASAEKSKSRASVAPPSPEPGKKQPAISDPVIELEKKIQSQLGLSNISISFGTYGTKEEKVSIKVLDNDTGEVIREIPPKEIQKLSEDLGEMSGMFFNKKA